jgi:hypothetical protein
MECNICCEEQKEYVNCVNCKHVACATCCGKYLLDNLSPACMACKEPWSSDHIRRNFPLKWVEREWKTHCKKSLLDQEKSWMPETQEEAKRLKKDYANYKHFFEDMDDTDRLAIQTKHDDAQALFKKAFKDYTQQARKKFKAGAKLEDLPFVLPRYRLKSGTDEMLLEIGLDKGAFKKHWFSQAEFDGVINEFQQMNFAKQLWPPKAYASTQKQQPHPVKLFHKACPVNDCRGFLSTEWKCGICSTEVCKECHFPRAADHKCNPDHVKSAKVIERTTRPCPRCAAAVFKTDGCDHMWCTACNTGFSWRTGEPIGNQRNTNPYFYQWLRSAEGRQARANDVGAAQFQVHRDACFRANVRWLEDRRSEGSEWRVGQIQRKPWHFAMNILCNACTFINEFDTNEYRRFHLSSEHPRYGPDTNLLSRAKFLAGVITEKEFLIQAMKNKKRIEYEKELRDLYATTANVLNEWIYDCVNHKGTQEEVKAKGEEYKRISEFFTANSKALAELYDYTVYPTLSLDYKYYIWKPAEFLPMAKLR